MTLNPKSSRVLELYQLFQSGASINKQEFAERYGINVRSVQRDIDTIRDFLANQSINHGSIQSINYDKSSNSYKLVSQNINYLSNGEMLALCKILIESRAFTKEKLTSLLNNILSLCVLPSDDSQIKDYIANELFYYNDPAHAPIDTEYIWKIAHAIKSQRYLEISYAKMKHNEVVDRKIMPVGILFSEYYFYLMGIIESPEIRKGFYKENDHFPTIYRVDRIKSLSVTNDKFHIPYAQRFKEGEYKNLSQFMFGGEVQNIQFKYYGPSIEAVLDKLPNAEITSKTENYYIVNAEVFGTGILMWLLSQGSKIEVLSPEGLRASWLNEAKLIVGRAETEN